MQLAVSSDMLVEGRHFLSTVDARAPRPQGAGGQPERPRGLRRRPAGLHARAGAAACRRCVPRSLRARAVRTGRCAWHRTRRRRHDGRAAEHLHHRVRRGAARPGPAAQRRAARRRPVGQRQPGRRAAGAGGVPRPRCAGRRRTSRPCACAMERPQPRVALGQALRGLAHERDRPQRRPGRRPRPCPAALGRRRAPSRSTPCRGSAVLAAQTRALQHECLLAGGDDYELLFSAPRVAARRGALPPARAAGVAVTRIGCDRGRARTAPASTPQGGAMPGVCRGFDHFAP